MGTDSTAFYRTRGVVLYPSDLTWRGWPERAARAGLTTIALHHNESPGAVVRFIQSREGRAFLDRCRALGLQVEYELHAMKELLPRALFERDPALFRMNEHGQRTPDANLCVHSARALQILAENALALSRILRPTTGRYFLWWDDGQPGCRCAKCAALSDSDQALILENHLLRALHREDQHAQVAHLAYGHTYLPPTRIRPEPGVFLEFAPIRRRYDIPLDAPDNPEQRQHLKALDANLAVFGSENAQALEYWLDVSLFSKWRRPAVKLPFDPQVLAADLNAYGTRGVRHITSFAAYIDAGYVRQHGEPPLEEYGKRLRTWLRGG